MSTTFGTNNRRSFPRFTPKNEIFVFHSNFGKVINISMGGVLFCYHDNYNGNKQLSSNDILFSCCNSKIEKIPFQTIADIVLYESAPLRPFNRLRRVLFENLSPDQIVQLEHFMLENVRIPQLSNGAH